MNAVATQAARFLTVGGIATAVHLVTALGLHHFVRMPPHPEGIIDKPGVKVGLNSHDAAGGPHTLACAWTSKKFHDENPVLYKALMNALAEASEFVTNEPLETAKFWVANSKSKLTPEFVAKIITKPEVKYSLAPERIMTIAEFVQSTGLLKKGPAKWQDVFFPEAHAFKGS